VYSINNSSYDRDMISDRCLGFSGSFGFIFIAVADWGLFVSWFFAAMFLGSTPTGENFLERLFAANL